MLPLEEFDPNPQAIINPQPAKLSKPAPKRAVLCFFQELLLKMSAEGQLETIGLLGSEIGMNPIMLYQPPGSPESVLVVHPGVGAPLGAAFLEEVIALGCERVTACGGCGVLRKDIAVGHPVVLTAAVRDEGTSFHYQPPSREIQADPWGVAALEEACQEAGIAWLAGKAWTTDAFYRETPERRDRRIAEGCDVVEMEAATFFAVARFRGIRFGQIVYGGDLVVPEGWDQRDWNLRGDSRKILFDLAVSAVLKM